MPGRPDPALPGRLRSRRGGGPGRRARTGRAHAAGPGSPSLGDVWDRDPDEPTSDPDSQARYRRAYGRFTRNFVVQGTGAEWALCWIADLRNRLWRLGEQGALDDRPHLVFFLHDEVVVHAPEGLADAVAAEVAEAATAAGRLLFRELPVDFPLNVSVVRLPRVHDTERQGLITPYIATARAQGAVAYVGEGRNRWPAAHVDDVARLYALALEHAAPGQTKTRLERRVSLSATGDPDRIRTDDLHLDRVAC